MALYSSGQLQTTVMRYVECRCDEEHACGWRGLTDLNFDPEDGLDALWTCPLCGCEWDEKEGSW